jgi:hypothetical protein
MVYMICRNRVANFPKWKQVIDTHAGAHREAGLSLLHLWRDLEDSSNVFFVFEVASIQKARAFISAPEAAEAAKTSGVLEGEYHFVEDTPA